GSKPFGAEGVVFELPMNTLIWWVPTTARWNATFIPPRNGRFTNSTFGTPSTTSVNLKSWNPVSGTALIKRTRPAAGGVMNFGDVLSLPHAANHPIVAPSRK